MVRSLWWSDGIVHQLMEFWTNGEVAEGWLVLASDSAISQLQQVFGPLKRIGSLTREIALEGTDRYARTNYFETDLES